MRKVALDGVGLLLEASLQQAHVAAHRRACERSLGAKDEGQSTARRHQRESDGLRPRVLRAIPA
jgi:hypothetical protein